MSEIRRDQVIARIEQIRDGYKQKIREGSADGYWDHLQADVDLFDACLTLLRQPQEPQIEENDHGAALLRVDPISEVTTEALPTYSVGVTDDAAAEITCATCRHLKWRRGEPLQYCDYGSAANPQYTHTVDVPSVFGCIFHQPAENGGEK